MWVRDMEQSKILIVEDDLEIARIMMDDLRRKNYFVTWASTGKEGLEEFHSDSYDLILVDLMMPEMDGFTFCTLIRKESDVPLLIVSARNEDASKINSLNLGADDYITKPFSLAELSARIGSHLRRYKRFSNKSSTDELVKYEHGLAIHFQKKAAYLHEELLPLTAKEIALLLVLAKHSNETFTKKELYERVWNQEDVECNNTVTVHIKSLRSKLKEPPRDSLFIQTVWGSGYRFIGVEVK